MALLRAASNNPRAVGRTYYTFDVYAKNRGLCPHVKNHPLGGNVIKIMALNKGTGAKEMSTSEAVSSFS